MISLIATAAANVLAGVLTLAFVNGTTIVETNPYSSVLLHEIGAATLLVHIVEIAVLYPLALLVSRAIASTNPLLKSKRIYLFTFSLLVSVLPAGASIDLLSDVLVVTSGTDALAGPRRIVLLALLFASAFATIQVERKWTLGSQSATRSKESGTESSG